MAAAGKIVPGGPGARPFRRMATARSPCCGDGRGDRHCTKVSPILWYWRGRWAAGGRGTAPVRFGGHPCRRQSAWVSMGVLPLLCAQTNSWFRKWCAARVDHRVGRGSRLRPPLSDPASEAYINVPLASPEPVDFWWNAPELLRVDATVLLRHNAPGAVAAAEVNLPRALEIAGGAEGLWCESHGCDLPQASRRAVDRTGSL